jgi:Lrp/AsnC family leucine-responsive transcriptional regulator
MIKFGLDNTDLKILEQLDLNSRISYKELGRKLRLSKETCNFRVKRLVDRGYIKAFLTTVDISKLNRMYYKIFYKFQKTTPEIEKQIMSFIMSNKTIAYLATLDGRYDLIFLILAKDINDLHNVLVPLRDKFGEYILEQQILVLPSGNRFHFKFFSERPKNQTSSFIPEFSEADLDKLDYNIITRFAGNSRIKLIDLAKENNTDINVIKYRLNKIKKQNILGQHTLAIDFERFGLQQIQIDYALKNHKVIPKMVEFVSKMSQCTFTTVGLGKYDLAVEFAVENIQELRTIQEKIRNEFAKDITDHDFFVMKEHSINWCPL